LKWREGQRAEAARCARREFGGTEHRDPDEDHRPITNTKGFTDLDDIVFILSNLGQILISGPFK
jgi:hypothetical protein